MKTIQVDEGTWKALKFRAVEEGRTLATVVADAVARYLRKAPSGSVAGYAAGDLEVRRSVGTGSSDVRADASAPVRLGQAASTPEGSVAKKNEGRRVPMVEGQRFEVGDVPVLTIPAARIGRAPETVCGRCRVPWKNHQEGSRKNRAVTTGCTTFEDPTEGRPDVS